MSGDSQRTQLGVHPKETRTPLVEKGGVSPIKGSSKDRVPPKGSGVPKANGPADGDSGTNSDDHGNSG